MREKFTFEEMAAGLKQQMEKQVVLSPEAWSVFKSAWQPVHLAKNQILTDFGEVERYFYYVHSGVIRAYFLKDGEDYNVGFSYDGDFSGVYDSFVMQKPANFCLETISDFYGIRISYDALQKLYDEHKIFERWGRLFNQMIMVGFGIWTRSILADTAEERFIRLFEQSPQVFQIIPQKHLASYLGMTPETFSRMRKKTMG